ncbi:hypothetical protein MHYP_G00156850 [Metynnis hypsauchen]
MLSVCPVKQKTCGNLAKGRFSVGEWPTLELKREGMAAAQVACFIRRSAQMNGVLSEAAAVFMRVFYQAWLLFQLGTFNGITLFTNYTATLISTTQPHVPLPGILSTAIITKSLPVYYRSRPAFAH